MKRITKTVTVILMILLIVPVFCGCENSGTNDKATKAAVELKTIVLEPDVDSYVKIDEGTLNLVKTVIETRIVTADIKDYKISADADKTQIVLKLPEEYATRKNVEELTAEAHLTFRSPYGDILLDNSDVASASAQVDSDNEQYLVLISFTDAGKEKFAEATEKYTGQQIGIYLDDTLLSNPTVQAPIDDGEAQISGDFTADDVEKIANQINSSRLPFPLTIVESESELK